jgi:hypothetical protein
VGYWNTLNIKPSIIYHNNNTLKLKNMPTESQLDITMESEVEFNNLKEDIELPYFDEFGFGTILGIVAFVSIILLIFFYK